MLSLKRCTIYNTQHSKAEFPNLSGFVDRLDGSVQAASKCMHAAQFAHSPCTCASGDVHPCMLTHHFRNPVASNWVRGWGPVLSSVHYISLLKSSLLSMDVILTLPKFSILWISTWLTFSVSRGCTKEDDQKCSSVFSSIWFELIVH